MFCVTLEFDRESGELMLPLPRELLNKMGWRCGDTLVAIPSHNGFTLRKAADTEIISVETVCV